MARTGSTGTFDQSTPFAAQKHPLSLDTLTAETQPASTHQPSTRRVVGAGGSVVHSARNAAVSSTSTATHGTTSQRPRDAAPSAPCRGPPLCVWLSWSLISRSAPRRRGVSRSAPWASTRRSRRLSPLRLEAALTSVRSRREARRCPRSLRQRGRGRHQAGCRPKRRFGGLLACDLRFLYL